MVTFACVKEGAKYGPEFVNTLFDMVRRNLASGLEGRFVCLTDDPAGIDPAIEILPLPNEVLGLGWWAKLALFKPGMFLTGERVIYLDLKCVITGPLDQIAAYDGDFAILRDFYRGKDNPRAMQSSVMSWRAGAPWGFGSLYWLWECWLRKNRPLIDGGDQIWLERVFQVVEADIAPNRIVVDYWQDLYPGAFKSYKADGLAWGFPDDTRVVIFHGRPWPSQLTNGWVPHVWKIGGGTVLEMEVVANVAESRLLDNVRSAMDRGLPSVPISDGDNGLHAVLVGGGPSLKAFADEIRERARRGQKVFALNGAWRWLVEQGIRVDAQLILDGRVENIDLLAPADVPKLLASQCAPELFDAVEGQAVALWHAAIDGLDDAIGDKVAAVIGPGTTVGIKALGVAYVMGFRTVHLYGYDSSYAGDVHHAYTQTMNDGERIINVICDGQSFSASPWMATQAQDFQEIMPTLMDMGVTVTVHGDGLIPAVAKAMARPAEPDKDIIQIDSLWWPSKDLACREAVLGSLDDVEAIMPHVKGYQTVVQAGGNCGVWPIAFSKRFQTVYTFEPDWLNFRCLAMNATEPNIVKMQAALGSAPGLIDLARDPMNCGAHHISGPGMVPTLRVDDLGLTSCDLIQLDVEGYELNALMGAEETIKRFHPVIVTEDKGHSERYGAPKGSIEKWLAPLGYVVAGRMRRDVIFIHQE